MTTAAASSPTSRGPRAHQGTGALSDRLDTQQQMLAELRGAVDDQRAALAGITAELQELRSLAARSHLEVLHRLAELHGRASSPLSPLYESSPRHDPSRAQDPVAAASTDAAAPLSQTDYARLVIRVRALIRTVVPGHAVVAVVSRGDDGLIDLDGHTGWHFPRCDDGRYAGHYPEDSGSAIAHLEDLRRRGARYLVIPATALWWLDHYAGLRGHLEQHYRLLVHRADACAIFVLDREENAP